LPTERQGEGKKRVPGKGRGEEKRRGWREGGLSLTERQFDTRTKCRSKRETREKKKNQKTRKKRSPGEEEKEGKGGEEEKRKEATAKGGVANLSALSLSLFFLLNYSTLFYSTLLYCTHSDTQFTQFIRYFIQFASA